MPLHPRLANEALRKDATGMFSRNHRIDYELSEDTQNDDKTLQKLKDLSGRSAGSVNLGCRDTIGSVLSKYGVIRNEVQQDPRIGLVLSAECFIGSTSAEGLTNPPEDTNLQDIGSLQPGTAQDLMTEYAKYLSNAVALASEDSHARIDGYSTSPNDASENYDTDETEMTWDEREATLFDICDKLNTDLFQAKTGMDEPVYAESVAKPDGKAIVVLEEDRKQLQSMTNLSMSPIVQIAVIEPKTAAPVAQELESCLESGSHPYTEEQHAPVVDRDATQAAYVPSLVSIDGDDDPASPLGSFHDSWVTAMLHVLHDSAEVGLRSGSLLQEDYTSLEAVPPGIDRKPQHGKEREDSEPKVIDHDALEFLKTVTDQWHREGRDEFDQTDVRGNLTTINEDPDDVETVSPFFAYLEQNHVAEHVLDAGIAIMLAAVVLADQVFW